MFILMKNENYKVHDKETFLLRFYMGLLQDLEQHQNVLLHESEWHDKYESVTLETNISRLKEPSHFGDKTNQNNQTNQSFKIKYMLILINEVYFFLIKIFDIDQLFEDIGITSMLGRVLNPNIQFIFIKMRISSHYVT